MIRHEPRPRPAPWAVRQSRLRQRWLLPFVAFDWCWEWVAFLLSRWNFLEVLEYLGSFSVLVAVIFYFSESNDRIMQRHYQAWQVINTAQGKGGSGGRIEALQELNADQVPLVGVDVSSAFLQGIHLGRVRLIRANLSAADLRNSDFHLADFSWADLHSANLRYSDLQNTIFDNANLQNVDLFGSDLAGARLDGADLSAADLRSADLKNIEWKHLAAIRMANIAQIRNAPDGFIVWALQNGAIQKSSDE